MTTSTSSIHVITLSCYVALLDEASPANRLGFMDTTLASCKQAVKRQRLESFHSLFAFNDALIEHAKRGDMLSWTLLFDGVFRAHLQVEVGAPSSELRNQEPPPTEGRLPSSAILNCLSGRLLLCCMGDLGKTQAPAITVEPGWYRASVTADDHQELDHAFLTSLDEYPSEDGPDWTVRLEPATPRLTAPPTRRNRQWWFGDVSF